ncbi:MAG TPA: tetratricopeptide repeat protein [bacterium]|nr:tetratricopeptide repeat protein [bacterium]
MPSIDELEKLVQQFPDKAFPRYGLAMEYKKASRWDEALTHFRKAIELDPNYTAAFFHAGMACEAAGRKEDAKQFYRDGLVAAKRVGNSHAAGEIGEALRLLEG